MALKTLLGMDTAQVSPDYQLEKSEEFYGYVKYHMARYFDGEKEPERYFDALREAVDFANKSVLLHKLGLGYHEDLEAQNPQLFKSMFAQVAAEDPNLLVKGESVYYSPNLIKSLNQEEVNRNEHYEQLWMKTCEAIKKSETQDEL